MEPYLKYVALESLAMAMFALKHKVGHKLHLYGDYSRTLTFLTTSTLGIKREILGGEAHLMREGLVGIEFAYGIVGLDIGGGIRACAFAYWILIDKLHVLYRLNVATYRTIFAWCITHLTDMTLEGGIENALNKTRLARTAHTRNYSHHIEREGHINALEVVHSRPLYLHLHIPRTATLGKRNGILASEILEGVTLG